MVPCSKERQQLNQWVTCFVILLLLSIIHPVYARFGMNFSTGEGLGESITPHRVALRYSFGPWLMKERGTGIHTHLESSFGYWNGSKQRSLTDNDRIFVTTLGPMFRWQMNELPKGQVQPYLELGVSASWLTEHHINGRRFSTHFQFEDKIGAGVRFGQDHQYELGWRFYHYSNASIKRPNSGVNFNMIHFGYWFPLIN